MSIEKYWAIDTVGICANIFWGLPAVSRPSALLSPLEMHWLAQEQHAVTGFVLGFHQEYLIVRDNTSSRHILN